MKNKFFACARSTYDQSFKVNLKAFGDLKKEAAESVLQYPPKCWVRAYFSSRCLSAIIDNNLCESFNAWIDEFMYLLIIRMIDRIRIKLMSKWDESDKNVAK